MIGVSQLAKGSELIGERMHAALAFPFRDDPAEIEELKRRAGL